MAEIRRGTWRALMMASSLLALTACSEGLDLDLRDLAGGPDTSEAVRQKTERRPRPDDSGLISYPSFQVAVAKRGDTVQDVADRIGYDPVELASYNGLRTDTKLRAGEVLALPEPLGAPQNSGEVDITALASDAIERSDDDPTTEPDLQSGPEPVRHQVMRGETAYSISRLYNVSVRSLADWNGLGPDLNVREGQFLLIPVAKIETSTLAEPEPLPEPEPETTGPGEGTQAPEPPSASTPLPDPEPEPEPVVDTPAAPAPDLSADRTAASATRLALPVSGSIIRDYEKGKSDGIDISASAGTPVKAAAAGTVAAITRDTDGVPILVLRHSGNLLTVYANIDDLTVAKGDSLSKGQVIAKVRSTSPAFLHFEVREGFDSVDPARYLN